MARKSKLEATVARIQARFGHRALTRGGPIGQTQSRILGQAQDAALYPPRGASSFDGGRKPSALRMVPHIPTGYPELDALLGIGGLPKGKVCEIVGRPTSGKTTLTLRFLAQAQAYGPVAYLDQARFFDADYARRCGLDLSRLLVGRPYDLTECLSAAEALAQSETLSALVIDASESLWLGSETSSDRGRQQMGAFLNRLIVPLARSGLALLVVHDGEPRRGVSHASQGTPLAHHAALRLGVGRVKWLKKHGDVRGCQARVEVLKNRLGPSGRSATIAVEFSPERGRLPSDVKGLNSTAGTGLPPHEDA